MPSSDNITLPYVSSILQSLRPNSALDIGIGMGKFGFFFREACEWSHIVTSQDTIKLVSKENWRCRLDGIEVCPAYITPLQRYLYDEIFVGPAEEIAARLEHYDLIFLGDVIEHFEKSEGQRLLDLLFEKAKLGVLIVTPAGEYEQAGTAENPHEEHKSVWDRSDFSRFPCVWARRVAGRQWIIFISRQLYWLADPFAARRSMTQHSHSRRFRAKLKQAFKMLFGAKALEWLLMVKRRIEGWNVKN